MRHGVEALFLLRWFDTRLAVYSVSVLSSTRPGVPNVCVPPSEETLPRKRPQGEERHDSVKKNGINLVD